MEKQNYVDLLEELLETTTKKKGNPEVIYPLLEKSLKKLDRLDENFTNVFRNWATAKLSEVDSETVRYAIVFVFYFSLVIMQFPFGSEADIEIAITGKEVMLTALSSDSYAETRTVIQFNLGAIYSKRIKGDKAENLEVAIAFYKNALKFYNRQAFPENWAMIQNSLAMVYRQRIKGDKAENLEMAIAACKNALEVFTPEILAAEYWASTQYNSGIIYSERIEGDKAENLEMAIAAYKNALQVYIPQTSLFCLKIAFRLGNLAFTQENWQFAINVYEKAMQSLEATYSGRRNYINPQEIREEASQVYHQVVRTYMNMGQYRQAIETVERSKAYNLVELLAKCKLYPKGHFASKKIAQLDQLRRDIPRLEKQLEVAKWRISNSIGILQESQRKALYDSKKWLEEVLLKSQQQLDLAVNIK